MSPLTVFVMKTGHSSSLLPSTTTSDSAAQEGYESRGGMMDWKESLDSTDSLGAVSSHNHQDKKGKALEALLPLRGEGGRSGEDCVTASS